MPALTVVSGSYGKGSAEYEHEVLKLPKGVARPVDEIEAIELHGSVAGEEGDGWASEIFRSLKSGLSIASNLSGPAGLAAGALSGGLSALDQEKDAPRALLDITFRDGASVVALAHPALAALILHDRDVVTRTAERLREAIEAAAKAAAPKGPGLIEGAQAATGALADKASSILSSTLDLVRRGKA